MIPYSKSSLLYSLSMQKIQVLKNGSANRHTLFRKESEIKNIPIKSAKLYITADDCYKAYINGKFFAYGPAQALAFAYNYNAFEIKKLLKPGLNTLLFPCFLPGYA